MVEWPHLVLDQEEVDLIIMTHNEIDRITKEMEDKPFKCQQLIKCLKPKSTTELLQNGVKDRTTMMMQANLVATMIRLTEVAERQAT